MNAHVCVRAHARTHTHTNFTDNAFLNTVHLNESNSVDHVHAYTHAPRHTHSHTHTHTLTHISLILIMPYFTQSISMNHIQQIKTNSDS